MDSFHRALIAVIATFAIVRVYYHYQARRWGGPVEYREGDRNMLVRGILGFGYMGAMVAYLVDPGWLAFARVELPDAVRLVGLALSAIGLGLLWWVHHCLGVNFSSRLHLRERHELVTDGPYRWVRHPMYTVFYLTLIGWLLLSGNVIIGALPLLGLTAIVAPRVSREEATMLERFGDAYRAYLDRTGRFIPRFGSTD